MADIEVQDLILTADGSGGGSIIITYPGDTTKAQAYIQNDDTIKLKQGIQANQEDL